MAASFEKILKAACGLRYLPLAAAGREWPMDSRNESRPRGCTAGGHLAFSAPISRGGIWGRPRVSSLDCRPSQQRPFLDKTGYERDGLVLVGHCLRRAGAAL